MSGWPTVALNSVADVIRGVTYAKSDVVQDPAATEIPILRAGNIRDRLVTNRDLVWLPRRLISDGQLLQKNDILMCMSSGSTQVVGKSALVDNEWTGSFGAFCAAIRTNATKADPRFVAYILSGPQFRRWASAAQGNNIKNLNKSALEGYGISLPPLDEQRRIVELLDRAAEIRRRADAARTTARALIPALFLDTFGDPVTNPKGWPIVAAGKLLKSASYGTSRKANDQGKGIPIIRMGNVGFEGSLNTADLKHIELEEGERQKAELQAGDILFNRTNSKELVGKTGLWDGRFEAVAASYFIRIRVKPEICHPAYLWAFMNTKFMKQVLFATARGAIGQSNINASEFKAFRIAKPPQPLQTQFAEQIDRIAVLARALDAAAAKAERMAAALAAELFDARPAGERGTATAPSLAAD